MRQQWRWQLNVELCKMWSYVVFLTMSSALLHSTMQTTLHTRLMKNWMKVRIKYLPSAKNHHVVSVPGKWTAKREKLKKKKNIKLTFHKTLHMCTWEKLQRIPDMESSSTKSVPNKHSSWSRWWLFNPQMPPVCMAV